MVERERERERERGGGGGGGGGRGVESEKDEGRNSLYRDIQMNQRRAEDRDKGKKGKGQTFE